MAKIKDVDFYHGALTSVLLNNSYNIILFEKHDSRRSYKVSRDNEEYFIYSKYSAKPSPRNKGEIATWTYSFTNLEVEKIKGYMEEAKGSQVALVSRDDNGGELVLLDQEEFLSCIGYGWKGNTSSISVMKKKHHKLRVYGRGICRDKAFIPKMRLIA